MASRWFQPPSLRLDENLGRERRTGWLELFYDLVLAATVSQASLHLSAPVSLTGLLGFVLLVVPVWFSWVGVTCYHDRFETDDVGHRLLTVFLLAATAAVAVYIPTAQGPHPHGFVWAYVSLRLVICLLWWRGGFHSPVARPLTNRYLAGFGLGITLWLASLHQTGPVQLALWTLAVLTEMLTPVAALRSRTSLPQLSRSRLPERFGQVTVILMGGSVVAWINGVAGREISPAVLLAGLGGLGVTFGLWWLYVDTIMDRRLRQTGSTIPVWVHGHLWLALGLVALGAGMLQVIRHADALAVPGAVRWLVCGMAALSLVAMGLLESTIDMAAEDEHLRWLAPIGAVALLLTALLGHGLGAGPLVAVIAGLILLLVLADRLVQPRADRDMGSMS